VGNIVRLLGGSRFAVGVARVLSLTIPVAICRSVGQDNDMVATFWLLCMVWFAVRLLTGLAATWDMVGFSASFALALLTKQYALLYALPVCIVLALRLFTRSPRRILTLLAIGAGMTMLVNAPHAARKYQFLGNMRDVLWPAKLYPSTVSIIGVRPTFSTLSRFAALMIMLPNARYEKVNRSWLDAVHRWMGLDPQDPRTTEQPWGLSGTPTYGAANIVAVFGIAVCLLFGLWRRHPIRRTEFVLLACMGAMLLLLATFSKFHIDLGRYLIRFHVATLTRPIVCVKYIIPFVKGS